MAKPQGYGRNFDEKYSHFGSDTKGHDIKAFGDTTGKFFQWDASSDQLKLNGLMQFGSSASQMSTSTADVKFLEQQTKTTATSGDSRSMYVKHELGGTIAATGYGDCVRAYTVVTGTGYSYASGLHGTMQINAGATVTGSGSGIRATLAAAAASRTLVGALSSLHVCSDIGTGNTMPTVHGFMRFTDDGAVRISNLAVIPNASNGTIFAAHTTQTMSHSIRILSEDGTAYYIMCTNAATNRS